MTIYLASESGLRARCATRHEAQKLRSRLPDLKPVSADDYWQQRSEFQRAGESRSRRAKARAYSTRLAAASKE